MNWYKTSMPLPSFEGYPEQPEDFQETTKKNLNDLIPETLETKVPLKWIGSGSQGMAFIDKINPHKIIKYTMDDSEFKMAKYLLDWQKSNGSFNPHIVGVYNSYKLNDDVYVIELERVRHLTFEESIIIDFLISKIRVPYGKYKNENTEWDYLKNMSFVKMSKDNFIKLFKEFQNLINYMKENNFYLSDLHPGNLGWRNEKIIFLDLGHLL